MHPPSTDPFQIPPPSADQIPAADFSPQTDIQVSNYSYAIKTPRPYITENEIKVRESVLRKVRSHLKKIDQNKIDWSDLFLALTTLSAGIIFSTLLSGVDFGSIQGKISYTAAPAVMTASLVAYIFMKRAEKDNPRQIAKECLLEIPDPDDTAEYEQ